MAAPVRIVQGLLALAVATLCATAVALGALLAPGARASATQAPSSSPADAAAEAAWWLARAHGGTWEQVADTGSMTPALTARHYAVLLPVDIRDVRPGDIVVFRARVPTDPPTAEPRRVVHRVVEVGGCEGRGRAVVAARPASPDCTVLRVKGDANPHPDAVPVTAANFEGRVAWVIDRDDGSIRDVVARPRGRPVRLADALAVTARG